ncbi:hypothetical protein B0P06_006116 [Clostridium saccharoperbutylacetonicum]|uniref:Uncharacterized protein n=1 Tax=Clostridium saccharoperbutylacetonicum N1-4(HMT) TaxID=931276 RepID=M1M1W1_9CLOT|nr:hypothetical protein [Clostridium saccharoperbutylacetonicum]AGF59610.1 hypothetical protein Cspa_135p00500 [Clostridium saccharoperbutylacetonicum N1-4(HMT)]NRT64533.1 hypothetical protein [Clostridium saccharoperbutylacetonicum]NSB29008.1 hypothetical protein [Clostridium saccharoperbutylacetonicum]NSB46223.1 hypothetical protein [Clostridium saccharoperbutylacetonicum]
MNCLIYSGNKYFGIENNELAETTLNIENAFDSSLLDSLRDELKAYAPFKIVLFNANKNKSMVYKINSSNAFILINLTNIKHENIQFENKHKMLVSNDLKNWDNYYDSNNCDSRYFENYSDRYIKDYVNSKCKYINYISKNYSYILLKLNDGELLNKLFENILGEYKRIDYDTNFNTGAINQVTVTFPEKYSQVLIKKTKSVERNTIIKDSIAVF